MSESMAPVMVPPVSNAGADQSKDSTGTDENDGRNGTRGSTTDSHHSTDLIHWPPGTN